MKIDVHIESKLEEIKKMGSYAVRLYYGEEIGCDDSDVDQNERMCRVIFVPVGCLGGSRIMFYGSLKCFLQHDFQLKPQLINNPPSREDMNKEGYFIWGERSEDILNKPFHGEWK